ncbi:hypothetical protein WL19_15535 [Burkholderia ubonensis]|nr:hypothetical protein WL19_15535 [Burkholderia ubonensis]
MASGDSVAPCESIGLRLLNEVAQSEAVNATEFFAFQGRAIRLMARLSPTCATTAALQAASTVHRFTDQLTMRESALSF